MIIADAAAEQLHATAGAGGLDDRRLHAGRPPELLRDSRGERINS